MSTQKVKEILLTDIKDIQLPDMLLMNVKDVLPSLVNAYKQAILRRKESDISTYEGLVYVSNGHVDTLMIEPVATNVQTVTTQQSPAANDEFFHVKPISYKMTTMARGLTTAINDDYASDAKQTEAEVKLRRNSDLMLNNTRSKFRFTPRP